MQFESTNANSLELKDQNDSVLELIRVITCVWAARLIGIPSSHAAAAILLLLRAIMIISR